LNAACQCYSWSAGLLLIYRHASKKAACRNGTTEQKVFYIAEAMKNSNFIVPQDHF